MVKGIVMRVLASHIDRKILETEKHLKSLENEEIDGRHNYDIEQTICFHSDKLKWLYMFNSIL
jgi:hypothetical protein